MLLRLELIIIISYLIGIYMQVRPSCRQIDFNYIESVLEFQSCEHGERFYIKSYADLSFESYRNVENHLTNVGFGLSCFSTVQLFNLNSHTEFDLLIYLNSLNAADESFVEIQVFDTEVGKVYFVGSVIVSNDWNEFHARFSFTVEHAQIEIRANTTADALLAIEYLNIVNPSKAEANCRRTTTTSTEPTTVPTEPTEIETTEPTEPQTTKPTEPETTKPTEPETTKPTEPETTEPETTEPTEPETTKPTEPETTELTEPETTEPTEPETTKPTEAETTTVLTPTHTPIEPTTQTPTDSPTEPPSTPEVPGDVVCTPGDDLLPNPRDCNSFYQCVNGAPVLRHCASDHEGKPLLVFNPNLHKCVYPDEYDCNASSQPPWE